MNINIQFNNNNYIIKSKKYQSIYSLINQIKEENNLDYDINDLFLDYNGIYLNNNLSLEKYDIQNNYQLNLNLKLKGGDSFSTFFKKNPYLVIFVFLFSLLPLFILPTGFLSSLSTLIENIIKKSSDSIGKYLVCYLGKKTLYNRLQWLIVFIKYVIFFLMVFVIITLPLILLCVTIKGHNIMDSPSSMCKPIHIANYTGTILTVLFICIYGYFRVGNIVILFIIDMFKKVYILDTIFNPILSFMLKMYNSFKYIPIYIIPYIGSGIASYFTILDAGTMVFQTVLNTVVQLGCKITINKKAFISLLGKTLNSTLKGNKKENENKQNTFLASDDLDMLCVPESTKCCNPSNFVFIADSIKQFVHIPLITSGLKSAHVYSTLILIIEALYEYALSNLGIDGGIPDDIDERVSFFKDILVDKSNKLDKNTISLIKEYLTTYNPEIINDIKNKVGIDLKNNIEQAENINDNLNELIKLMKEYSYETGSIYLGKYSLCKIILKYVFLNSLCNVFQTTKTSFDIINHMKGINNVCDMIKAGSATGVFMTFIYLIALIALIVLGIFNKY